MIIDKISKMDILVIAISFIAGICGIIGNSAEGNKLLERLRYVVIPLGTIAFFVLYNVKPIKLSYLILILGNIILMLILGTITSNPIGIDEHGLLIGAAIFGSYYIAKLVVDRKTFYPVLLFLYIIVVIMTIDYIPQILFKGASNIDDSIFNEMSSQNGIGSWLVTTAAALTVVSRYEKNITPLWPSLIAVILSVFLYSRNNIATAGIIIFSVLFFDRRYKTLIVSIVTCLVIFLILNYGLNFDLFKSIFEFTQFADKGMDSPRYILWHDYITNLDATSIFLGLPPDRVPIIKEFANNPHSALIRLFGYFGIYPFIILFFMILTKKINRIDYITAACLLAIIARSMTDVMFVGMGLDLLFFVVLLIFINNNWQYSATDLRLR